MYSDCVHLVLEVVINNNGTTGVSPTFPLGFFSVRGQIPSDFRTSHWVRTMGDVVIPLKNLLFSLPPIALPWYHI